MNRRGQVGFWVGTYTTPAPHVPEARGQGILRGWLDLKSGDVALSVASDQTPDPSYLARLGDTLATVSERPDAEGELHLYQIASDDSITRVKVLPTHGRHPCHLAFVEGTICLANYMGRQLIGYELDSSDAWQVACGQGYEGRGANAERQEAPHLHQVVWLRQQERLAVVDLGSDRIWFHPVVDGRVSPEPTEALILPPGAGPRHIVYAEGIECLYALCELSGRIEAFRYRCGQWQHFPEATAEIAALPDASAIRLHPAIPQILAASRRNACIAAFAIEPDGSLREQVRLDTQGQTPRDFAIDPSGQWLLVANQDSHAITVIGLGEEATGAVRASVPCPSPVCILFD